MSKHLKYIEGDKAIWLAISVLAFFSFMPIYSASTNLVYVVKTATSPSAILFKHAVLLILGFVILYGVHKIPYRYFSGASVLMLPIVFCLLLYTLTRGSTIGGANASRWINIPIVGIGFQTSTLAGLVLMTYVARYLARNKNKKILFKESFWYLWVPVGAVLLLILPANFSTTAILFCMILVLTFIGGYSIKYIAYILGMGIAGLVVFILLAMAFPDAMPNRVDTWKSRIENFSDKNAEEAYQVEKAKIAIATGGIIGVGPGKSVQKNFLPQSSSDFIYAIIVEEFGLVGGIGVVLIYLFLLFRIMIVAKKAESVFATLLVIGIGVPIVFQAMINMAVAINLFPVTGQTLPLISSGGTSIWMTCFAIGMILSVSSERKVHARKFDQESPLNILDEAIN
jgi:cell division protein FtsW|tara:strand:+ start:39613 stop:40806 length:1194 start_codon:yes stop_codon:yes gene_type:complete